MAGTMRAGSVRCVSTGVLQISPWSFSEPLRGRLVVARALQSLLRPQELPDRVVEGQQAAVHRRVVVEQPQAVVVQERRARPDRDQGGDPIEPRPASARQSLRVPCAAACTGPRPPSFPRKGLK